MAFPTQAVEMYAMIFSADGQGVSATYYPLAGGSQSLTVIVRYSTDQLMDDMNYRVIEKPIPIWIQKSDVTEPLKGDRIAITDGETYQVASIDVQDEFISIVKTFRVRTS